MAGDGNYGGNGSVYWQIRHTDKGAPAKLKKKSAASTKDDHWLDLGSDFTTTGGDTPAVIGHDPTSVPAIGGGSGQFKVALRFSTSPVGVSTPPAQEAYAGGAAVFASVKQKRTLDIQTELQKIIDDATEALREVQNGAADVLLAINVPGIERSQPPSADWEVSVQW